jgi:hypothetical protein
MRTWISFRTPIRGIRVGASLPNPAARVYPVSAIGRKVWNIGSTVIVGRTRDLATEIEPAAQQPERPAQ